MPHLVAVPEAGKHIDIRRYVDDDLLVKIGYLVRAGLNMFFSSLFAPNLREMEVTCSQASAPASPNFLAK